MSYVQYNLEGIEITAGIGAFDTIGEILKRRGVTRPLLVTDRNIRAAGSLALAEEICRKQGIPYDHRCLSQIIQNIRDFSKQCFIGSEDLLRIE